MFDYNLAASPLCMDTTTKKPKAKGHDDAELPTMIRFLTEPEECPSSDSFDFFTRHVGTLIRCFAKLSFSKKDSPSWRQLYLLCLKNCIQQAQHETVMFHFKVVKHFWVIGRQSSHRLSDLITAANAKHDCYKGYVSKRSWPAYQQSQILIDYFIKSESDCKTKFMEKVIDLQCQYFSTRKVAAESLFEHYLKYVKNVGNITIFSYAASAYMRSLINRNNQELAPQLNLISIFNYALKYFQQKQYQNKEDFSLAYRLIYEFTALLKNVEIVQKRYFFKADNRDVMEAIIRTLTLIDPKDSKYGLNNLICAIVQSRKQNYMLHLGDRLALLESSCSIADSYRYIANLLYQINLALNDFKRADLSAIVQVVEHNLKLLAKKNEIESLQEYLNFVYAELLNLYRSVRSTLFGNQLIYSYVQQCVNADEKAYPKMLPIYDLLIVVHGLLNQDKQLQEYHQILLQEKLKILLGAHIRRNNKDSKASLIAFFNTCFLTYFQKNRPAFRTYLNTLRLFSHLSRAEAFDEISNRFMSSFVKILKIGSYASENPQANYAKMLAEMIQYLCQHEKNRLNFIKGLHFAANFIKSMTIGLIETEKQFREINTSHYWEYYLQHSLQAFFYVYDKMEEEDAGSVTQVIFSLVKRNYGYFLRVTHSVKLTAFNIVGLGNFTSQSRQTQLLNVLTFYEELYLQMKEQLKLRDNICFIDFCFNIKADLYNKSSLFSDQSFQQSIETILNRVDEMEMTVLQRKASQYIESESLSPKGTLSFIDVLSVSIKSIFFFVYQQKFYSRKLYYQGPKRNQNELKYFNFEDELESYACKLVAIKERCQKMLPYFKEAFYQYSNKSCFGPFEIRQLDFEYGRTLIAQLNDLMYIAHLCGLEELKSLLLTIRLSLIYQHESRDIFLLEVAKYVFLGIYRNKEKPYINFLKEKVNELDRANPCRTLIEIIVFGQAQSEPAEQNVIFNMLTLMNQEGIAFLMNCAQAANYLIPYVFRARFQFSDAPSALLKAEMMLRPSVNSECYLKKEEYFLFRCWEEGWVLTRLIVMLGEKMMKAAIDFNQLSTVHNFYKFALFFCVRTAHISDIGTPLSLAMKGQYQLHLMKIVDSIVKIEESFINKVAYNQIEGLTLSRRSSMINSNEGTSKIEAIYNTIEDAFRGCSLTGTFLASLFCQLAQHQLHLKPSQSFKNKYALPMLRSRMSAEDEALWNNLNDMDLTQNDREAAEQLSLAEELAGKILSSILSNYSRATVPADWISNFIQQALHEMNFGQLSPRDHERIDRTIALIGLAFEDHNYAFKKAVMKLPRSSIRQLKLKELDHAFAQVSSMFSRECAEYHRSILKRLEQLLMSPYPVSMIFPLGKKIYTVSFSEKLLVTYTDRACFEERVRECQAVTEKHRQIIYQTKTEKINKQRMQLDAQLKRTSQQVDIGIFDINLSFLPPALYQEFISTDLNILKFVYNATPLSYVHFDIYRKRFRLKVQSIKAIRAKITAQRPQRCDLLLLIHHKYLQFPIQIVKSVRQNRGIYRLPSVQYLLESQNGSKEYNINNCRYVVNSDNNLKETEQRFLLIKKNFTEWSGICKRQPSIHQIRMALNYEVYLYMGHGTGFQHIQDRELNELYPKSLMLVFGCSSAKMKFDFTEPFGNALTMLMRGCPAYLGCLWEVTDFDIDKITAQIFVGQHQSLSLAIESARRKCFFPHLNGSSVVIYGLPAYIQR